MSFDEKRNGLDALGNISTTNYLDIGDNAYGYIFASSNPGIGYYGDLDYYRLAVDPGFSYTVGVSTAFPLYAPNSVNSNFALLNRYGDVLAFSYDYGSFSGFTFNTSDSLYYIAVYGDSVGHYSLRASNNSIIEDNQIGETLPMGAVGIGRIDYSSDVDIFAFYAEAGKSYDFSLLTTLPDSYIDIEYQNVQAASLSARGSGIYTFTAEATGVYDLIIGAQYFRNTGSYSISFIELDTTPPRIIDSMPMIGDLNVDPGQNISVLFTEFIQRGTGTISLRAISTGVIHESYSALSSSNISINGSVLTINPTQNLRFSEQYRVEFSSNAVKDYSGNAYGGSSILVFTTGPAPVNLPPTSANGAGTTNEDMALTAQLPAAVDPEGGAVAYAKVNNPAHGVVTVATNGSYTYSPAANYAGGDSFGFSVADGTGGSNLYTVTLTITPVNDAPAGSVTVTGNAQIFQTLAALSTLSDIEGMGTLSYQWLRAGTVVNGATSSGYELGAADVGTAISVRVSYTDGAGSFESVTSSATAAVAGYNLISGTVGPDILVGTSAPDRIDGLGGKDQLSGGAGRDALNGGDGDDTLRGGSGNDDLSGGSGIDIATYDSVRGSATYIATSTGHTVTSFLDGTDTLSNIERLKFADISIALDLSGSAGIVAKILGAVFGREAVFNEEYAGIGLYYIDGGMTYESLMQLAIDARLGPGASHQAVVDLLYTNVVGVPPGDTDRAYFVGLLDTNVYTVASLGVMAADIDLNLVNIDLVGLAQQGLEYAPYEGG